MKRWIRKEMAPGITVSNKVTAMILLFALAVCQFSFPTFAAENNTGKVVINQVYGASNDGYASHSFIELYNTSDKAVDINGWSLQYKSSIDGNNADEWSVCVLTGIIAANGYYLIRCGAVTKPSGSYQVPEGNQEWDISLHNKGLSVVLMKNDEKLTDSFSGDVTAQGFAMPEGFVDLAAVQGNDATEEQIPPAYEGTYAAIQSKKKSVRRTEFRDTDNNKDDFIAIDYSKAVSVDNGPHTGNNVTVPSYTPVETTNKKYYGFFNSTSSLKSELIARYNAGAYSADGGSAEISVYNSANGFIYSVNGVKGTLDCVDINDVKNNETVGTLTGVELSAAELAEGIDAEFTYGDITSVAVSSDKSKLAMALQDEHYAKTGRVLLFSCAADGSLNYIGMAKTGVQPDMVCFNADDTLILTADEGEPRMGANEADPKGSVTIINTSDMSSETVDFTAFDNKRNSLIAKGIVIQKDTDPSVDFEPEYIAISENRAYISLQEANAIAVLDINAKKFIDIYSVGFEDYSRISVDLDKSDETYQPATYENIKGIRMPDGISVCTINGETYLLTANEGDSRAWPVSSEEFVNEIKSDTSPVNGIKMKKKVTWFDANQYDGLEAGMDYVFGARSFTIFKLTDTGMTEVFDSKSDFEAITAEVLPDYFNCSNEVIDVEDRSGKKGPEPESVIVGTVGKRTYAFIALERIGGVMMYDITEPENTVFENYINSRDFSADIKNDVSPEGLYFITADESPVKKPLLVVSNEVSGTISVIELTFECVHSFGNEWKSDADQHWHECECGEKSAVSAHTFEWITDKEAEAGVAGFKHKECTVCGYKEATVEIPALPIPEYPPVIENSDGGKVEIDNQNPKPGDKVTFTPQPDDGKQVDKIVVIDKDGNEIPVVDNGDGSFSFIQPDSGSATIKVDFEKKPDKPGDSNKPGENAGKPNGSTNAPQTGDNSHLALWIVLMFVACCGVIAATAYSKKKREIQ